jgi:hypothetical protein
MVGRSPRLIFRVVGQSRDDVPTVGQAGSHHPGSQQSMYCTLGHAGGCDLRHNSSHLARAH